MRFLKRPARLDLNDFLFQHLYISTHFFELYCNSYQHHHSTRIMKTSTILATCALALLNTQTCLASLLNDTASIPDRFHLEDTPSIQSITSLSGEPVPFKICESFDNATAGFIVNEISLSPNPPVRGQDLDIIIKGDLHKQMAKGALVRVVVWKFGMAFAILEVSTYS